MNWRTTHLGRLATPSHNNNRRWQQAAMAPFLALCLCLSSAAALGQENAFPQVKQIFDQKAYGLARQGFLTLAEEGDPRAMFYLGVIYNQGLGTPVDLKEAFTWYEKAAKLGHAVAQYNLGNAFKHGRGTEKSEELSLFWWQKAAEQGQENAQYNLGLQYYLGMGVVKDLDKAVFYFQEAANGGHPKAQELIAQGKIPARPPGSRSQQPAVVAQQPLVAPTPAVAPAPKLALAPLPTTVQGSAGQLNAAPAESAVVKGESERPSTVDLEQAVQQRASEPKPLAVRDLSEAKPPVPARAADIPRPSQAAAQSAAPALAPPSNGGGHAVLNAAWLRAQDPTRFTIQLAVMTNQTYLESFLTSYGLKGTAKVLEVSVANQKRYHVLLGDFPGEDTAQAQINGLAAKLQALKPWPRSYKALLGVVEVR